MFDFHILGEWYDLNIGKRNAIRDRLKSIGCSVFYGQTPFTLLKLDGTSLGPRGYVYFAKFNWKPVDRSTINIIIQQYTNNEQYQLVCMKMLAVKIGSTVSLFRSSDDNKDDDSVDETDVPSLGRRHQWRGADFVTKTSQLTNTIVKAFECDEMMREERELHNLNYNNGTPPGKWVGNGEWFRLNDAEVDAQLQQHQVIDTDWTRRLNGKRDSYYEDETQAWIASGLVDTGELHTRTTGGRIKIIKRK